MGAENLSDGTEQTERNHEKINETEQSLYGMERHLFFE